MVMVVLVMGLVLVIVLGMILLGTILLGMRFLVMMALGMILLGMWFLVMMVPGMLAVARSAHCFLLNSRINLKIRRLKCSRIVYRHWIFSCFLYF